MYYVDVVCSPFRAWNTFTSYISAMSKFKVHIHATFLDISKIAEVHQHTTFRRSTKFSDLTVHTTFSTSGQFYQLHIHPTFSIFTQFPDHIWHFNIIYDRIYKSPFGRMFQNTACVVPYLPRIPPVQYSTVRSVLVKHYGYYMLLCFLFLGIESIVT